MAERDRDIYVPSRSSFAKWPQLSGVGQIIARIQELVSYMGGREEGCHHLPYPCYSDYLETR